MQFGRFDRSLLSMSIVRQLAANGHRRRGCSKYLECWFKFDVVIPTLELHINVAKAKNLSRRKHIITKLRRDAKTTQANVCQDSFKFLQFLASTVNSASIVSTGHTNVNRYNNSLEFVLCLQLPRVRFPDVAEA